jgi:hypothetical protein
VNSSDVVFEKYTGFIANSNNIFNLYKT